MYRRVPVEDGQLLQFLGVHVLRWQESWGDATVGFVELDMERLIDRLMVGINSVFSGATAGIEHVWREMLYECIEKETSNERPV